jgi:hypothetical protein
LLAIIRIGALAALIPPWPFQRKMACAISDQELERVTRGASRPCSPAQSARS